MCDWIPFNGELSHQGMLPSQLNVNDKKLMYTYRYAQKTVACKLGSFVKTTRHSEPAMSLPKAMFVS